jgi:hypothetical protein
MSSPVEDGKAFLLEGSRLYEAMIRLTTSEVIRRYLAFRIIVNAMSFEDLSGNRKYVRFRQIRNVLLAHKQEEDFFAGYHAADEITNATISPLVAYMAANTTPTYPSYKLPELSSGTAHKAFSYMMPQVFEKYHEDFLSGFRLINNHLCYTGSSIQEVSAGEIPGVFYRYHSSMSLFQLSQYIFNNASAACELAWTARHAKLDMILHAQNLADTVFKDVHNQHSINGLAELMIAERIGCDSSLRQLKALPIFKSSYSQMRQIRNKLIGHMDTQTALSQSLVELDAISVDNIYNLTNMVDKAVCDASNTNVALRLRFISGNQPINNPLIVDIRGLKPAPYF